MASEPGKPTMTHRVGKIQSEQLWDEEQKQARDLGEGELPIGGQGPLLHVGHGGHQFSGDPSRACSPGCGWARQRCPLGATPASCNRPKEIAFADPMAFCLQLAANGFTRVCPWRLHARRHGRGWRRVWATAGRWVGLGRKVEGRGWGAGRSRAHPNERIDSDARVKAFGHFLGGVLLQKVGPTNLVVEALGGGRRLLEQGGKCGRTCHGSWGWRRQGGGCPRPSRQLSPDRGREAPPDAPGKGWKSRRHSTTADRDAASQAKVKNTAGAGRQVAERPPRAGGGEAGKSGRKSGTGHEKWGASKKVRGTAKIGEQRPRHHDATPSAGESARVPAGLIPVIAEALTCRRDGFLARSHPQKGGVISLVRRVA